MDSFDRPENQPTQHREQPRSVAEALTNHGRQQTQDRGFSAANVADLLQWGRATLQPNGCMRHEIRRREAKGAASAGRRLWHLLGCVVIVASDSAIVTVYRRGQRAHCSAITTTDTRKIA